jgi:hypothetical protein
MYYTTAKRGDGFGAILQNILFNILYTDYHKHTYVYTPILSIDHNYTNDFDYTKKLNEFINLANTFQCPENITPVELDNIDTYPFVESHINELVKSNIFTTVKNAFLSNKSSPFSKEYLNVSIHIRRPNIVDERVLGADISSCNRYTDDTYYLNIINKLRISINDTPIRFHIYSQGNEEQFHLYKSDDTIIHLNESIQDTFLGFVYADVLVLSRSSFSYVAGFLTDATVIYDPNFWHTPLKSWINSSLFETILEQNNYQFKHNRPSSNQLLLRNILEQNGLQFENNKIKIPSNFKHIKFDIGLSYGANQSQNWLSNETDLLVFGFEPNPNSVNLIRSPTNTKQHPLHPDVLEQKYINTSAYIIPIAFGNNTNTMLDFYVTENDEGCSSLYKPVYFPIKDIIKVPVFSLSDFFELLPLDTIPYIEYIKIDAQGSDFDIIQSGGTYIRDKVVFVTLEPECNQYSETNHNNEQNITNYMNSNGFQRIHHSNIEDPTYVNLKFLEEAKNIYIFQKG